MRWAAAHPHFQCWHRDSESFGLPQSGAIDVEPPREVKLTRCNYVWVIEFKMGYLHTSLGLATSWFKAEIPDSPVCFAN